MSKGIAIREFYRYTPKEVFEIYRTNNKIIFEDGVIVNVPYKDMIMTRYCMEALKQYPELPIVSKYLVSNYYTNGVSTSKTLNKLFEAMLEDIVIGVCSPNNDYSKLEELFRDMTQVFVDVYNELGCGNLEYSASANILDYLDIQLDKDLIAAIKEVGIHKDITSINKAYDVLDNILRHDPKYVDNPISKSYVSGMVNPNQIKQILAPRGYVTEIDGGIFKFPIASSFTLGMNSIYDLAIESRSGAKALFLSNKAVQDSEYLARELQLVTMVVEKLIKTDCGNNEYINWYVRPNSDTHKGDLKNMIGKRYLDVETNKEKIISSSDTHLEGTTIKLRSVLKCKLKDKKHVCSYCFGELSYGVFDHSNIGHYATATITQKITQSILSTKHLTTSATSNTINLIGDAPKFFIVKEQDGIAFRANILGKTRLKQSLIITQEEAFGLKDINVISDIAKLDITRVSKITSMVFVIESAVGKEYFNIPIKDGGKYGSFTHKFLEYIVGNGYKLDEKDRYTIDVSDWKYSSPIIMLPQLEFSFLELSKTVKKLFKYIKVRKSEGVYTSTETPESLLQKFFDLINSKLDINIALMEIMIYGFTINNLNQHDYGLARGNVDQEIADITHIMPNRSLGGNYAWEDISQSIINASSFRRTGRMDHPLDVMLKPGEVIQKYHKDT